MLPRQTQKPDISGAGSTACAESERLLSAADSADLGGFPAESLVDKRQLAELPETQPKSGVYFLWLAGELQYIGASKSINARMYIHECAKRYGPTTTGYAQIIPFDRVTYLAHEPGPDMRRLERELIARFEPPCNTQNTSRAKTPKAPDTEGDGIPDVVQQPVSDKPRVAIVADEEVAALIRGRAWEPMIWQVGSFWYADASQLARWRETRAAAASGAGL